MKKFLIIFFLSFTIISCNKNENKDQEKNPINIDNNKILHNIDGQKTNETAGELSDDAQTTVVSGNNGFNK